MSILKQVLDNGAVKKVGGFAKSQMTVMGAANALMSLGTYNDEREKGHGVVYSAGAAALQNVFYDAVGLPIMLGVGAMQMAPAMYDAYKGYAQNLQRSTRAFSHGYQDTQAAYTMRQRSLQAINASRLNTRSALGNEAQYMHR